MTGVLCIATYLRFMVIQVRLSVHVQAGKMSTRESKQAREKSTRESANENVRCNPSPVMLRSHCDVVLTVPGTAEEQVDVKLKRTLYLPGLRPQRIEQLGGGVESINCIWRCRR